MPALNGYSSKVALTLHVDGKDFALSHIGSRNFVVRDECSPLSARSAEIIIEVNDSAERHLVWLTQGLSGPGKLIEYVIDPATDFRNQLLRRMKSWPSLSTSLRQASR